MPGILSPVPKSEMARTRFPDALIIIDWQLAKYSGASISFKGWSYSVWTGYNQVTQAHIVQSRRRESKQQLGAVTATSQALLGLPSITQ